MDWQPTSTPPTTTTYTTPLAIGELKCFNESSFPTHGDVDSDFQLQYVGPACADSAKENMNQSSTPIIFNTTTNGTPYRYSIAWIDGCQLANGDRMQNVYDPIGDSDQYDCMSLLRNDYTACKFYQYCYAVVEAM